MEEAKEIHLKNINLITKETKPVVNILNSSAIYFDKLKYKDGAALLFNVQGERSSNISVSNTNVTGSVNKAEFSQDAKSESLTIK